MRLQCNDDHVLGTDFIVVVRRLDVFGNQLCAIVHDELHAVFPDRFKVFAAHDECHVFAGQCQLDPDISPDRPCADNRNFHVFSLFPLFEQSPE